MPRFTVDRTYTQQVLHDLVSINSINPSLTPAGMGEAEAAACIAQHCEQLGLETTVVDVATHRPNVIARWQGTGGGKSLLLTGHTDVVGVAGMTIPPFEPEIRDGRLYGRGAYDMKGGLAAILGTVKALKDAGFQPAGDLVLGFVIDEEFASLGTDALVKTVKTDAAILTEPTGLEVGIAHRGFAWVKITVEGQAAHGSFYEVGIDAINQMGRVLAAMDQMEKTTLRQRVHPLLGRASVHASLIKGGVGISTYPDRCELQLEHRLLPDESAANVLELWHSALSPLMQYDDDFNARTELIFQRGGYEIAPDAPIVQAMAQAHETATGSAARLAGALGWLDSAILGAAGIPTVIYGPGGDGAHAAVEYVELDQVFQCAAVLAEAAANWTSV